MTKENKVRVYYNLHKQCFSVVSTITNRVILHTDSVFLEDVKFIVRQSGRERVLREGKKNVHAFVMGTLREPYNNTGSIRVSYNPYKNTTFVRKHDNSGIYTAKFALLKDRDIFVEE